MPVFKHELGPLLYVRWFALNKCIIIVRIIIDRSMEGRTAMMEIWVFMVARHSTVDGLLGREDHLMLQGRNKKMGDTSQ